MKKVLVVEDNESFKRFLQAFVKYIDEDNTVNSADSAEEALKIFKSLKTFDLIIIDIALLEMNGLELCLKIRETDKNVPIFAVSGYKALIKQQDLSLAGFDAWFFKVDELKELMKAIEKILK